MNRREWVLAACGAGLGLGTAGAAWAGGSFDRPSASQVEEFCSLQEQGAVRIAVDLEHRERELDARESAIEAQKSEMAIAETRLTERMAELERTREEIKALVGTSDAEREARVDGLVKMIEANRANSVAPMFRELDAELAVTVLDRMNRTKAGRLLAALPAGQAAALAERMTAPLTVQVP